MNRRLNGSLLDVLVEVIGVIVFGVGVGDFVV